MYLSPENIQSMIRDTLTKIISDEDPDKKLTDTGVIAFAEHIPLYKYVTMQLIALDSGIVVQQAPDSPLKEIDTLKGNVWAWSVFAKSADKEESQLMLVVKSEQPNSLKQRIIHIKIHVESNWFRIFYNYLIEHPGDFILKIIVPAIAAIWGVIFLKRRRESQ